MSRIECQYFCFVNDWRVGPTVSAEIWQNSAENLVNFAAHRGKADEIQRLTADTQLNIRLNHESTGQIHVMNLWILHYSFINLHLHHSAITISTKNNHKQTRNAAKKDETRGSRPQKKIRGPKPRKPNYRASARNSAVKLWALYWQAADWFFLREAALCWQVKLWAGIWSP